MSPIDRRLILHINWLLLGLTLALFFLGVMNLYSASGYRLEEGMSVNPYYRKQLIWGAMGLFCMVLFMIVDYRKLKTLAWPFYWATVGLLVSVFFFGVTIYGARRWLDLGFFNFQPSEMAKICILLVGARILAREQGSLGFIRLFYVLGVGLLPAGLVILEPDLGSGMNVLLLLGGMILYRGLTPAVLKSMPVVMAGIIPLGWFFMHDYQKRRVISFLDPASDPLGSGYHVIQSQIAIGSGGFWGKGWLAGTQSQLRFLPEKHTDFVVSVFGEEWGFAGTILLLVLFCSFLYQSWG